MSNFTDISDDIYFIGQLFNNKYVIIKKLGKGSFATVWLSYNINDYKFYAIKIQFSEKQTKKEISILKKINKEKYFTKLLDHFIIEDDLCDYYCMVFDLMAGSMYDLMRSGKYKHGYPLNTIKKVLIQVLNGLDILFKKYNYIHTDIKPENILIVGVNKKINEIINEFNPKKFNILIKKCKKNLWADIINKYVKNLNCIKKIFKEYEKKADLSPDEEIIDDELIDEIYINNIEIKLSDFGSCVESDKIHHEIQTRYYRAPEAILYYDINNSCDTWSIGCMMYELLTNSILFNPNKKYDFNRNRHHLYEMQRILGPLPNHIINKAIKKNLYFRNNGLFKGINKIQYVKMSDFLKSEFKINKFLDDMCSNDLDNIIDLMYDLLEYDSLKRIKFDECLKHPFFN